MFAPRKTEHERQHAAPASSLRERRQRPAPNQRRQARIMPPPPTPAVRNLFIAPVGGGYSHIHLNNDRFSHQEPECAPPPPNTTPPGHAHGGFCSIRSPVTACRRRVAPLMLQFPPLQPPLEPRKPPERTTNSQPCPCFSKSQPSGCLIPPTHRAEWGFCTTRGLPAACRRRVEPPCSAIPPGIPYPGR